MAAAWFRVHLMNGVPSAIVLRRRAKALGGAGRPSGTGHGTDYPTEAFPVPGGAGPLARRTSASL